MNGVIRPAILWNDQRTAAECEEIEDRARSRPTDRADREPRAPRLHRAEAPLAPPTRAGRLRAASDTILLPKDYVRLRLTGEHAIDVADASGTLLLDVAGRRWSDEVLDALEIPPSLASPGRSSRQRSPGRRRPAVPVAAGAGDCAAAALGVGVDRPGPASVVLGTSGVVFAALPAYAPTTQARVHVFCHAVPGTWQAMGVMLSAGGLAPVAPRHHSRRTCPSRPSSRRRRRWRPGAEGLVFLPYLQGERTPHADPDARGAFTGLAAPTRSRRARPRRARGCGLRAARLARPPA